MPLNLYWNSSGYKGRCLHIPLRPKALPSNFCVVDTKPGYKKFGVASRFSPDKIDLNILGSYFLYGRQNSTDVIFNMMLRRFTVYLLYPSL